MRNPFTAPPLGYDEKVEILSRSVSVYCLHDNLKRSEIPVDMDDFLLPLFRDIYKGRLREEFIHELKPAGLPEEAPDDYVNSPGNQPYKLIQIKYAGLPEVSRNTFILHARQSMLRLLRRELVGNYKKD